MTEENINKFDYRSMEIIKEQKEKKLKKCAVNDLQNDIRVYYSWNTSEECKMNEIIKKNRRVKV